MESRFNKRPWTGKSRAIMSVKKEFGLQPFINYTREACSLIRKNPDKLPYRLGLLDIQAFFFDCPVFAAIANIRYIL
jgi:hypothetical protein